MGHRTTLGIYAVSSYHQWISIQMSNNIDIVLHPNLYGIGKSFEKKN